MHRGVDSAADARALRQVVVTLVLLGSVCPAMAHSRLLRSLPPDKAALSSAPSRVELWFNELLDEGFNAIEVFPAQELSAKVRSNLIKGAPVVDAKDRTHLTVDLQPLAVGEYVVEWRVLSRDGHSAPGRFRFRVLASP